MTFRTLRTLSVFSGQMKRAVRRIGDCPFWKRRADGPHGPEPAILLGGLGGFGGGVHGLLLGGELGAELFNAAGFDDARLSARVERVAGGGRIKLVHRVGHAVDFDRFTRLSGGTDDERLVDGEVDESDLAVFGMNAFLHF